MQKIGPNTVISGKGGIVGWGYEGTPYEANVTIGDWCSVGTGLYVCLKGGHRMCNVTTFPLDVRLGLKESGEVSIGGHVIIGNDVWIGENVEIIGPCIIGDGACIGSRSVVSRDVPPYALVAGNPIKLIRYRFSDDIIAKLLKIKWWNWDRKTIESRVYELCSPNVEDFVRRYYEEDNPVS